VGSLDDVLAADVEARAFAAARVAERRGVTA
jgi:hypothetical protein